MLELISSQHLTALFQVIMIDLVLAGDNAIVIGLAAAGLPEGQRRKAILIGIVAATVLRIGFASVTVQLLQIIGLLLAGGVLLLWYAGRCGASCACPIINRHLSGHPQARWMRQPQQAIKRRLARPYGRSRSPTSRCRSTTCSPSRRGARASDDSDIRPGTFHCTDGARRQLHRAPPGEASAGSPMSASRSSSMWLSTCATAACWRCGPPQRLAAPQLRRSQRLSGCVNRHRQCPDLIHFSSVRGKPWLPPF